MRTFSTSPSLLRLLLIGLLLAAMPVKPVLAFDCVLSGDPQRISELDRSSALTEASSTATSDDGCPLQHCHHCCAHSTALLPGDRLISIAQQPATIPLSAATPFRPRPPLTVFRPPIAY